MTLKAGVSSRGVRPEIFYCIGICDAIYRYNGLRLVVTSLSDGTHGPNSLHYKGLAVDLRTRNIPQELLRSVVGSISAVLNPIGFDVVLEDDHLHIEFDPKTGETWQRYETA